MKKTGSTIEGAPKWLTDLQQRSWEPEILLSGIVLYGMFQAPELLSKFQLYAEVNLLGNTNVVENLVVLLKVAFYWLTFGLILHLVSRGVWVGMVGLSFTFPNGINSPSLKLAPKYDALIDRIPSMQRIVINLEKVCSTLFAISFMLFMAIIGSYLYVLVTILAPIFSYLFFVSRFNTSEFEEAILNGYSMGFLILGLFGLIDFLSLGFFKRYQWLSKIYYPLYRFIGALTLAGLYRPIYYTLVSNFNRWKIAGFLIFFVLASIFAFDAISETTFKGDFFSRITFWNNSRGVAAFSGYYDDQNEDVYSIRAHIQSDIISENTLRLFVVSQIGLEDSIRKNCQYDSLITLNREVRLVRFDCASQFYRIALNDSVITNLPWRFYYKQKTNQRGMITYVDISNLPKGMHELAVGGPEKMYNNYFAQIPFYREIRSED